MKIHFCALHKQMRIGCFRLFCRGGICDILIRLKVGQIINEGELQNGTERGTAGSIRTDDAECFRSTMKGQR